MPSFAAARTFWSAWRAKGTQSLLDLGRLLLAAPRDFLDAHFESPKVKAMMAAWGMHLDFPPEAAGGALFPYLESMANQAFGMVIGAGGADMIIRAMTAPHQGEGRRDQAEAAGHEDRERRSGATGVTLADGTRIDAKKAVIANLHPQIVFGRLMQPRPEAQGFDEKVARIRAGPGTMMIHLALDVCRTGAPARSCNASPMFMSRRLSMMSRAFAEARRVCFRPSRCWSSASRPRLTRRRAPPGKHVLWVQVRVLPATIAGDAAGRIAADAWDEAKEPMPSACSIFSRPYAPGLRAKILAAQGVLAARPRAREPLPDRRRQSDRQPPSRPELPLQARSRLLALRNADAAPLSAAPGPGRAPGPAPGRVSCWRKCWRDKTQRRGQYAHRLHRRRPGRALLRAADEEAPARAQQSPWSSATSPTTRSAGASCSPTRRSATCARPTRRAPTQILDAFNHWDDIDVHLQGRTITLGRPRLLRHRPQALARTSCSARCEAARRRARVRDRRRATTATFRTPI